MLALRERGLTIYGPTGFADFYTALQQAWPWVGPKVCPIEVVELGGRQFLHVAPETLRTLTFAAMRDIQHLQTYQRDKLCENAERCRLSSP